MNYLSIIDDLKTLFNDNVTLNPYLALAIDAYFALILIAFVVFLGLKFKKALSLIIIGLIMLAVYYVSYIMNLSLSENIYKVALASYIVIVAVILAPEIRRLMEFHKSSDNGKKELVMSSTQATKEAIADAVFNMAGQKVGALITIEQHISLEQYAERAINLNSDISRELLEQIFIKDSPLHDGGVIIRGNKIVCAAAYYTLTQDASIDKTVGSRHRAGLGLSEITDAITIIVSEETGTVHVATAGFMQVMYSKNELLEYLDLGLGKQ